ncbi:adenylyltransferase/cytidyltransferase family protein [Flavobacteriaceae bacterium]|nr:adenylyltransferase/cytidyltransferase family protein [Flavobacteriaceae bacterium]
MKNKAIIVSGYFNPIHKGHIEYFYLAKKLADILIVIVNNDFQREIKGSTPFMLEDERKIIVEQLKVVDKVFLSIDKDKSVSKTIEKIYSIYSKDYDLFFANGGDQNNKSIPELNICKQLGVDLVDGLGDKIQSSSWLIKKK